RLGRIEQREFAPNRLHLCLIKGEQAARRPPHSSYPFQKSKLAKSMPTSRTHRHVKNDVVFVSPYCFLPNFCLAETVFNHFTLVLRVCNLYTKRHKKKLSRVNTTRELAQTSTLTT